MTDLYRRLLTELTERFGGVVDEANADAIAYAAADLYHRDFEPRFWQEKSAHDLLDLFGVPRSGVFAPYSLSDRLILFQRRSSQSEYLTRAHELLDTLGVPRQGPDGEEMTIKWRLDQVMASARGERDRQANGADAGAPAAADEGWADQESPAAEAKVDDDGAAPTEAATPEAANAVGASENGQVDPPASDEKTSEPPADEGGSTTIDGGTETPAVEAGTDAGDTAQVPASSAAENGDVPSAATDGEGSHYAGPSENAIPPTPDQLADAVLALEQAAKVEEEIAAAVSGGAVDVVGLTETLNGIQGEIAALRELVEAFEIGMRRQLDELQAQVKATNQNRHAQAGSPDVAAAAPPPPPTTVVSRKFEPTRQMPAVARPDEEGPSQPADGAAGVPDERRAVRRVMLLVLLLILGLLLAGGIVLLTTVGWESLTSEVVG